MDIQIVATPPGEAPEWVRQAWVGLRLPVAGSSTRKGLTSGVLSGPRNRVERLVHLVTGRLKIARGYPVYGTEAVAILEEHRPDAARWWRENAPRVLKPGRKLLFHSACCRPSTETIH